MITIAVIFALIAVVLSCVADYRRNRIQNLEVLNAALHAQLDESDLLLRVRDLECDNARLQTSNSHMIREAMSMTVDLERTKRQLSYHRRISRGCKDEAAAVVLTRGLARPARRLHVWDMNCVP